MAVVTQWNPKEETVREILTLIDNIRQGIKELKELRQIKPPNQQIQLDSYEEGQAQLDSYEEGDSQSSFLRGKIAKPFLPKIGVTPSSKGEMVEILGSGSMNSPQELGVPKVFDELSHLDSDFGVPSNLGVNLATIQRNVEQPIENLKIEDWDRNILGKPPEESKEWLMLEDADMVGDSMKTENLSQENTTEEPLTGEFPTQLISFGNRLSFWDADISGTCQSFPENVVDFGNFTMGFCENPDAYEVFDKMPLRSSNTSDASILQENILKGCRSWNFDPGGTENLNFVALAESLGFEKIGLGPFLIVDSVGPKEPLVSAQALFGALSKKEIVWVETLLAFHAEFSVDLPSFRSIDSSSSFIFDPGGWFRKVVFGSSESVDKKVFVQWFTQFSDVFGGFTGDRFFEESMWRIEEVAGCAVVLDSCNQFDEMPMVVDLEKLQGNCCNAHGQELVFVNSSSSSGDMMELKYVIQGLAGSSEKSVTFQNIVLAVISSFPYDRGKIVAENWVYHKGSTELMRIIQQNASSKK